MRCYRLSSVFWEVCSHGNVMKKMILVDPAHMLLKTSPVPDPLSDSVLSLDDEIKRILDDPNLSEHEKGLQYQQTVQKYLTRVGQANTRQWSRNTPTTTSRTPLEQTPSTEASPTPDKTSALEKVIVGTLPKTLQNKGQMLLDYLKDATDLRWNDRGELISGGDTIKGSNVSDLIHETIRTRKLGDEPIGWKTYSNVLKQSNVPSDLILNKPRWESAGTPTTSPYKRKSLASPTQSGSGKRRGFKTRGFEAKTPTKKRLRVHQKRNSPWVRY